jgi:hypothetical protein
MTFDGGVLEMHCAYALRTDGMFNDNEIREARADWNEDRFRRLMRLRPGVVQRLRRRWERPVPLPQVPLGTLRRRYHANIAGNLCPVAQD